jgi:hypothetical protein
MGNDGGSIPKRRELVKEAAKNPTSAQLKETLQEQQAYLWTTDPLTNTPLRAPIVSDCNGVLYNKASILEFLLPGDDDAGAKKTEAEKVLAGAVRGLRDVVEVRFERDPEAGAGEDKWVCPITNKPLGPGAKAVYLVPCGHAFSGVAIREVADEKCLQCNEAYAPNDVIQILPTSEVDLARMGLRIKTLKEKGLTHSLKKAPGSKKRKKNGHAEKENTDVVAEDVAPKLISASASGTSTPVNGAQKGINGIKNASTASLTAKVLEEESHKKRKLMKNDNLKSLFSSRDQTKPTGKSSDFMTRGFSIPGQDRR